MEDVPEKLDCLEKAEDWERLGEMEWRDRAWLGGDGELLLLLAWRVLVLVCPVLD